MTLIYSGRICHGRETNNIPLEQARERYAASWILLVARCRGVSELAFRTTKNASNAIFRDETKYISDSKNCLLEL